MKMPPALTPWVAFSVPAILVLKEMESIVQVRLVILPWLKSNVIFSDADLIHLCAILYVNTAMLCFCCCSGVSQLKTTIDSFNRHQ